MKRKKSEGAGTEREHESPLRAAEQDAPAPERPVRTDEEVSGPNDRHPSQAEGER